MSQITHEQKFTLTNGVRVLIEEIPHVHSAALGFWVDVGSKLEDEDTRGLCHFIEHMVFKGTARRSALAIAQSLEASGGSLNAFTDKENTCFYARVLATEVPLALDVLCDMLLNSLFDSKELKREKAVVIEEIKMYEDAPEDLVHELLMGAHWPTHPLGLPITGTRGSVKRFTRDGLINFMESFYSPDRMVIAVAGNVKKEAVLLQLEGLLGAFRRPSRPVAEAPLVPRAATVVRYRPIEQAHLCLAVPGVGIADSRRYALALLNAILGGGMGSRLFQEVREKRGLVYSIDTYEAMFRPGGMFAVSAGMSPKHLPTVLALVHEEFEKAKAGDITETEIENAKRQLGGGLLLSLESPRQRMMRMAQNELYYGRAMPPEETLAAIQSVTLKDLQALAQALFDLKSLTITVIGPIRRLPSLAA